MLYHQQTRKFTIKLDKNDTKDNKKQRVIFGGINDMLFAFIPGVFLKLIDCGIHHKDPHSFVTLRRSKDNFLTDLPLPPKDQQNANHALVPLCLKVKNRSYILNYTTGEVYECTFSNNHFIKWLEEQQDCSNYVQVCHWAIVHLQNPLFAEQIIRSLYSKQLHCMGVEVLKEFLVANIFMQCKNNTDFQKDFLSLLRISTLEFTPTKPSLYDIMYTSREWRTSPLPPKHFAPIGSDASPSKGATPLHVLDYVNTDRENEMYSLSWRYLYNISVKNALLKAKTGKQWLIPKLAKDFTTIVVCIHSCMFNHCIV
jgi:hypothetical protein